MDDSIMVPEMSEKARALAFTSIGHFANDGVFLLFTLLIVYYNGVGVSVTLLGTLAIVYNIIDGATAPKIGAFVGRSDKAVYMSLGIALEGIAIAAFAASFAVGAYMYWLLIAGIVLLGVGQAFYHPIGSSVLRHVYGDKAPSAMGINGSVGSVGRALFPSLITVAVVAWGVSIGLGSMALIMFALAVILFFGLRVFEHSSYIVKHGKPEKSMDYATTRKVHSHFISTLTSITLLKSMFMAGTTIFIGAYINSMFHSTVIVGIFLTLSFLPAILGQLVFGKVTERMGGRYAITMTTASLVPIFAIFMLTNYLPFLILTYSAYAFFAYTGFPVILGYIGQVIPERHMTAIGARIWGIGTVLGGAAGIAAATALLDMGLSMQQMLWSMIIFGIIATALLPRLKR